MRFCKDCPRVLPFDRRHRNVHLGGPGFFENQGVDAGNFHCGAGTRRRDTGCRGDQWSQLAVPAIDRNRTSVTVGTWPVIVPPLDADLPAPRRDGTELMVSEPLS